MKTLTEKQKQDLCKVIKDSLNSARMLHFTTEDREPYPLVDFLSKHYETIVSGKKEIENIVEQIYFDLDEFEL